jgi:hypothetical protein
LSILQDFKAGDQVLTNDRWGVRDTPSNWSTFVYSSLEAFRRTTIQQGNLSPSMQERTNLRMVITSCHTAAQGFTI